MVSALMDQGSGQLIRINLSPFRDKYNLIEDHIYSHPPGNRLELKSRMVAVTVNQKDCFFAFCPLPAVHFVHI